jgi:hypothetical protein
MTDLTALIHDLVGLFDRLRPPYAIMGGIAVRAHGLPRPTFDVDIFLMENDFLRDVMSRRIIDQIEGKPVQLVTAEDLILFKLLAGRPRDLLDIKDILFMQGQLDEGYMRRWAAPLGVSEQLEQALSEREG